MSYASADTSYESPRLTPAVQGIIAVNVGIAFLQVTGLWSAVEMQTLLGFQWGDLQGAWWKALTYMFVHGGFLHLAGNMYMLWLFGPRLEHAWSTRAFLRFYVICGLGGWLLHVLFVQRGVLLGASAAVYGILFAYARQWKDEEMYVLGAVPVRVRWLVAGYIAYDLTMGVLNAFAQVDTSVAHYAHLGGVLAAVLYLKTPTSQSLEKLRQRVNQVPDVPDEPPRAVPKSLPRTRERSEIDDVVAKSKAVAAARRPAVPATPRKAPPMSAGKHAELDLVLDKISEQGIDSLTTAERRLLEEYSKSLRGRA